MAGAVKVDGKNRLGKLHPGEVVELSVSSSSDVVGLIDQLRRRLVAQHLAPVSVGRLMRDAGASV